MREEALRVPAVRGRAARDERRRQDDQVAPRVVLDGGPGVEKGKTSRQDVVLRRARPAPRLHVRRPVYAVAQARRAPRLFGWRSVRSAVFVNVQGAPSCRRPRPLDERLHRRAAEHCLPRRRAPGPEPLGKVLERDRRLRHMAGMSSGRGHESRRVVQLFHRRTVPVHAVPRHGRCQEDAGHARDERHVVLQRRESSRQVVVVEVPGQDRRVLNRAP
mmetsp:Transcript_32951/g.102141  ORF Transcript_32951/g.102141 Transcript_32951/m.102141 type:complete len:217 (-) Transcript_32951:18-668(-)